MYIWNELADRGTLGRIHEFKDKLLMMKQGEPADSVYFLSSGQVEIFHQFSTEQSIVVKILRAPTLFGVIEATTPKKNYLESVRVLKRTIVYKMKRDKFLEIIKNNTQAMFATLVDLSQAFAVASYFEPASLANKEQLLANLLLAYVKLFGVENRLGIRIVLNRTQEDFARATGAVKRSINRILVQWHKHAIVTRHKGFYVIRDLEALTKMAASLQGALIHPE